MKSSIVLVFLATALLACSKSLTLDDGLRGKLSKPDAAAAPHDAAVSDSQPTTPDAGEAVEHPQSPSGNSADCPAQAVEASTACFAAEGTVCAYTRPDPETATQQEYLECTCRADCGGAAPVTRWDCHSVIMGVQAPCPEEKPEDGSSCFGLRGNDCYYPTETECSCRGDSQSATWKCTSQGPQPGAHPTGIDESTRVSDLSADQRAAWCDWLTQREPGYPPWPELEPDSDGYYPNDTCADTQYLSCAVRMPLSYAASACVANLKLSSCEASLYDLTECVLTLRYRTNEHGCGHYIDVPGCDGTIALSGPIVDGPTNTCRLRVR
jgi:hypothetical protein